MFDVTLAKVVGQQSRAIAIRGIGAQPGADVDITIAPDLSVARVGNRAGAKSVEVRAFSVDKSNNLPVNHNVPGVSADGELPIGGSGAIAANLVSELFVSEPFLHSKRKLLYSTHARNTLEHNCARLAVAHLGPLKRRTGSAISAT